MREQFETAAAPAGERARMDGQSKRPTPIFLRELQLRAARGCECQRATAKVVSTADGYRALCEDCLEQHLLIRRVQRLREARSAMRRRGA